MSQLDEVRPTGTTPPNMPEQGEQPNKEQADQTESHELELSIVMPCLNESETLETCIRKAQGFLESAGVVGEVVIADNGSTDGSQEIARSLGARVIDVPVRGYGAAIYHGCLHARGKYIIMGDSDDSYDFSRLMGFVERLREGYDLVMGNRFQGGVEPGAMPWKNRYIGNPALSAMGRALFRSPMGDFHCGLRGFSTDAFYRMNLQTTGMEFASEIVIKAQLLRMKVCEVPTTLSPDGRSGQPHLRPWRDGWRHVRFMLLYSPRWLFLYPGMLLLLLGLVLIVRLSFGPIWIGSVGLDVHTMVYAAAMVLMGFQGVMFAILANIFGSEAGLMPRKPLLARLLSKVRLEPVLILAGLLFALGLAGSVLATVRWGSQEFGDLSPQETMRLVIPSMLLLTLGLQVATNGFFVSLLLLPVRTRGSDE